MTDPFTKKRALELMKKAHFDNSKILIEVAKEFGSRVGYAVAEGIHPDIAFEACVEHFKITGEAMIKLANAVKLVDGKLSV